MDPRVLNPDAGAPLPDARSIVYPSWMDGRYVTAASKVMIGDPIVIPGMGIVAIPGNAMRWGVGFLSSLSGLAELIISPFPRPDLFGLWRSTTTAPTWITLFTHGPLVTGQLYVYSSGGATIRLVEIEV